MPRVQTHVNLHKSFFLNTGVRTKKSRRSMSGATQVVLAKARTFRGLAEREGFLRLVIGA